MTAHADAVTRLADANHPIVKELHIEGGFNYDLERVGAALARNTHVKKFSLMWNGDNTSSAHEMEALCRGLASNRSIEVISFHPGSLRQFSRGGAPRMLETFLQRNENLKTIELSDEYELEDFHIFRTILQSCTSVERINFHKLWINEKLMEIFSLLGKLPNLTHLHCCLVIQHENETWPSLIGLSWLLQNQQSNLSTLFLRFWAFTCQSNIICPGGVTDSLVSSLKQNTNLKKLQLCGCNTRFEISPWGALKRLLRFDNHTLELVSIDECSKQIEPDSETCLLLRMNAIEDKDFIRIRKGLDFSYLVPERHFICEPLESEFDIRHLPYLIASLGSKRSRRDYRSQNCRFSALNHFVKNKSLLVVGLGKKDSFDRNAKKLYRERKSDK